jgi:hypothetical protein
MSESSKSGFNKEREAVLELNISCLEEATAGSQFCLDDYHVLCKTETTEQEVILTAPAAEIEGLQMIVTHCLALQHCATCCG